MDNIDWDLLYHSYIAQRGYQDIKWQNNFGEWGHLPEKNPDILSIKAFKELVKEGLIACIALNKNSSIYSRADGRWQCRSSNVEVWVNNLGTIDVQHAIGNNRLVAHPKDKGIY